MVMPWIGASAGSVDTTALDLMNALNAIQRQTGLVDLG